MPEQAHGRSQNGFLFSEKKRIFLNTPTPGPSSNRSPTPTPTPSAPEIREGFPKGENLDDTIRSWCETSGRECERDRDQIALYRGVIDHLALELPKMADKDKKVITNQAMIEAREEATSRFPTWISDTRMELTLSPEEQKQEKDAITEQQRRLTNAITELKAKKVNEHDILQIATLVGKPITADLSTLSSLSTTAEQYGRIAQGQEEYNNLDVEISKRENLTNDDPKNFWCLITKKTPEAKEVSDFKTKTTNTFTLVQKLFAEGKSYFTFLNSRAAAGDDIAQYYQNCPAYQNIEIARAALEADSTAIPELTAVLRTLGFSNFFVPNEQQFEYLQTTADFDAKTKFFTDDESKISAELIDTTTDYAKRWESLHPGTVPTGQEKYDREDELSNMRSAVREVLQQARNYTRLRAIQESRAAKSTLLDTHFPSGTTPENVDLQPLTTAVQTQKTAYETLSHPSAPLTAEKDKAKNSREKELAAEQLRFLQELEKKHTDFTNLRNNKALYEIFFGDDDILGTKGRWTNERREAIEYLLQTYEYTRETIFKIAPRPEWSEVEVFLVFRVIRENQKPSDVQKTLADHFHNKTLQQNYQNVKAFIDSQKPTPTPTP
ncbi:hypothetical protein HZA38_01960 [Candidatus Peregrinibacteria bacterium]|nr:hypothetical protein [Candidatus Peregrinibacteria bacterium]